MNLLGSIAIYLCVFIVLVIIRPGARLNDREKLIGNIVDAIYVIFCVGWLFIAAGCLYIGFNSA